MSEPSPLLVVWNDQQPIYRQIRDRIVGLILDGPIADGDPLPSVRTVAADCRVNPLTVLKAYQSLVDDGYVEKRRGLGMFVRAETRTRLLQEAKRRFLEREWPEIQKTIARLGLQDLLSTRDD